MPSLPQHLSLGLLLLLVLAASQCIVAQKAQRKVQILHEMLQLRVDGCPVLARGRLRTRGKDEHELMVSLDPLMCVTAPLLKNPSVVSRYDPIAKQFYVAIPVALKNNTIQEVAQVQLRHRRYLQSVDFATVTKISVSTDPGSVFTALGFVWSQGEPVGYLRLGCDTLNKDSVNRSDVECKIDGLVTNLRSGNFAALSRVLLSATLWNPSEGPVVLDYRLTVNHGREDSSQRGETLADYSLSSRIGQGRLPNCADVEQLQPQPVTFVRLANCSAAIYSVGHGDGRFLVETPICYAGSVGAGQETDDYSTGRHRVTLGFANFSEKDETVLSEVKKQLEVAGFKVKHPVTFMKLWGASHKVSGLLAGRYEIGSLQAATQESEVDAHAGSRVGISGGLVQVYCHHATSCRYLMSQIAANPVDFWRHIVWQPTYKLPLNLDDLSSGHCVHSPGSARFSVAMTESNSWAGAGPGMWEATAWREACSSGTPCEHRLLPDGRHFVVVQQRATGTVSFARPWRDYEKGFGDGKDFWIGLKAINLLSSHGVTMRVEMRLWNGTDLLAEYAGFTVGDSSTDYRMTYRQMISSRSNVVYDAMENSKGMSFSTNDNDNDLDPGSCSLTWGRGGWWFNACYKFYPNGLFPTTITKDWKHLIWVSDNEVLSLRQVRIMLQV